MDIAKLAFSGSTNGRGIKIAAGSTPGTTIHTAIAGTTQYDEIWLWVCNTTTSDVILTLEYGGVAVPDDNIVYTVTAKDGLKCLLPGLLLQNGLVLKAFGASSNVLIAHGFVNRYTP